MPEQYYVDLTPGLVDIPASTWEGIDPVAMHDLMLSRVPEGEKIGDIGLRALAARGRVSPPSPEIREKLQEFAPKLLDMLDEYQERQRLQLDE